MGSSATNMGIVARRVAALLGLITLWSQPATAQLLADFSATPVSGSAPLTVKFTDATSGGVPTMWQWTFGDGETSSKINPKHTYELPGTYSVKLKVFDAGIHADIELKTDLITVGPPVFTPAFSATPVVGTNPLVVLFTDETGPSAPSAWHWDFGDGATSNQQHPQHQYTAPGAYTVTLDVVVAGETGTLIARDLAVVDPAPLVPSFSVSSTGGVVALAVQFTDTSTGAAPTGWSWDFGDGNVSAQQHPQHTYLLPGSYSVSLDVAVGQQVESVTAPQPIVVEPADLQPGLTASIVAGVAPLEVAFSDVSRGATPNAWSWNFGDGFTSSAQHPQHVYVVPGIYSVTLTTWAGPQSASTTVDDLVAVGPYGGLWLETFKVSFDKSQVEWPWPLAARGDRAVEGAPKLPGPTTQDAVHVLRSDPATGWELETTLTADDGYPGDQFGRGVALHGRRVLVGAPRRSELSTFWSGVVYLFEFGADGRWSQADKLLPERPLLGGQFGAAVAIDGDRALIGAPEGPGFITANDGHAYLFERQPDGAWREVATLVNGVTPGLGGSFGAAVAIDGDWAFVGAPRHDESHSDVGRVDVFRRAPDGRWLLHQTLGIAAPVPSAEFGSALAVHEGVALVGAPRVLLGETTGLVEVWELGAHDDWRRTAVLEPGPGVQGQRFGAALALGDDLAFVGAPLASTGGFAFGRQGDGSWSLLAKLSASDFGVDSLTTLGRGAAIAGDSLLMSGRPKVDGVFVSAVYAYDPVLPANGPAGTGPGALQLRVGHGPDGAATLVATGAPSAGTVSFLISPGAGAWSPVRSSRTAVIAVSADADGTARLALPQAIPAEVGGWVQACVAIDGGLLSSAVVPLPPGLSDAP